MIRLVVLSAALLSTLTAQAGVYGDRVRQNEAQSRDEIAQKDAEYRLQAQAGLKIQINRFAAKHGGLRDAGECGPETMENCTFLAICVPMPVKKLTVAELGQVAGARIDQCEVTLGDGSVCSLTNEIDHMWNARRSDNAIPKLQAKCIDSRNVSHETYQY